MKKLFKLAVIGALVAGAVKMLGMQKQQWQGLTETEARAKLDAKMPAQMPDEKRGEVTEKIIGAMKDKGVIAPDPAPADVADQAAEVADQAAEVADQAADVAEQASDVAEQAADVVEEAVEEDEEPADG